jgi:hypothetical protein
VAVRSIRGRFIKGTNQVFGEWLLSEDENMRFDALAMVRDLRVMSAMPALRELATRLESSQQRGAPYELDKVNGLIKELNTERPF